MPTSPEPPERPEPTTSSRGVIMHVHTPPPEPASLLLRRPVATLMAAGIGLALMAGLVRLGLTLMRDPTGELIVLGFAALGVVIVWAIAVVFRAMDL